jgi:hypothetical protein
MLDAVEARLGLTGKSIASPAVPFLGWASVPIPQAFLAFIAGPAVISTLLGLGMARNIAIVGVIFLALYIQSKQQPRAEPPAAPGAGRRA